MSNYKLVKSSRGWLRILWPDGHHHGPSESAALQALEQIPGVRVGPEWADVPHTARHLESVQQALLALDAAGNPLVATQAVPCYEPATRPLYPYQRVAAETVAERDGLILADEMGLGKTAEALCGAEGFRRSYLTGDRPGVIVGPLFTRDTWRRELRALGIINDDSQFCALVSRNIDDDSFRKDGVRWYFVHYDVVRTWWSQLHVAAKPCVAILDEAHWVKNSRTQRAKGAAMVAGTVAKRVLLTGTPLENRPADLWNLLTIATGAKTWGHILDYRRRYAGAVHNGYGYEDTGPTNVEELRERLAPYYLRRTAADVGLQLPPLTRSVHVCEMKEAPRRKHDDILRDTSPEAVVRAVMRGQVQEVLPVISRLRQITSDAKIRSTVEYVENALNQDASVVIFAWERRTAQAIFEGLQQYCAWLCHGSVPQHERDNMVKEFQGVLTRGVLVATMGALREGVTLHKARVVVMHDLHWVLSHMLQAEKRIHRVGQRNACQSVWMLAENSIDQILAPVLMEKAKAAAEILGDDTGADAMAELDLESTLGAETFEDRVDQMMRVWERM